jgi:hypothetical protein
MARDWDINAAARALRAAGFEVEISVDNTPRPTAVVEAERAERSAARAERFGGYAENAQARSDVAGARADQMSAGIPLGQPVLVGHHSQRRHERLLERIQRNDAERVEEGKRARHWDGRADSAANAQHHRENIPTTLRRIDKLETELRAAERRRAGRGVQPGEPSRLDHTVAQLAEQIEHWKAHVAAAEAAGVKVWRQSDFARGDHIRCGGSQWLLVLRVNKRTLSVERPGHPDAPPYPLPYGKITGHRPVSGAETTPTEATHAG